ncbi:MAG: prepilin-type N-terminal cleavage/methylation domain-containing protein [Planctomycetes bacterium]|nr:prepilin-type N-terminal cleavage/methylation domain-containing protein [Planctomycetota bacterium]
MMRTAPSRRGLTLLELLLVVFILSAIALTAVTLTDQADEQFRYEDTKTRLVLLREATIGRPADGTAGFVADCGRLPDSLAELLEIGTLAPFAYDPPVGLSAGWRGPYLPVLPDGDGTRSFPDGWGNDWLAFAADRNAGTLSVTSAGSDGLPGGTDYAADYPPSGFLVTTYDHEVDLRPWQVRVVFQNPSGSPVDPGTVRLRLHYPRDGTFAWPVVWPPTEAERDALPWLSEEKAVGTVGPGGTASVVFRFETGAPKRVPWGERSLVVVDDSTGARIPGDGPRLVRLLPRAALPALDDMAWVLPR